MTWKISTISKKAIVATETFVKTVGDETYRADLEITWRWGHVIVSDNCKDLDENNPDGLQVTDYCIEDQEFDDGVAVFWTFSSNMSEEMQNEVEALWDDEGYSSLEENGWDLDEVETWFYGPLEIEDLGGDDEEQYDEPPRDPKNTWPF